MIPRLQYRKYTQYTVQFSAPSVQSMIFDNQKYSIEKKRNDATRRQGSLKFLLGSPSSRFYSKREYVRSTVYTKEVQYYCMRQMRL